MMPNTIVQCRDLVPFYNDDSTTETYTIPDIALPSNAVHNGNLTSSSSTNLSVDDSKSRGHASNEPDVTIPAESRPSGQVLMQANNAPTIRRTDTKDIIRLLRKYALYRQNIV